MTYRRRKNPTEEPTGDETGPYVASALFFAAAGAGSSMLWLAPEDERWTYGLGGAVVGAGVGIGLVFQWNRSWDKFLEFKS